MRVTKRVSYMEHKKQRGRKRVRNKQRERETDDALKEKESDPEKLLVIEGIAFPGIN